MLKQIDVKKALGIEAESKVERNDTPSTTREHQHQNQDNISQVNSQPQFFIAPLLQAGEDNAMSITELLKLTGLSNERTLRKSVADERAHGALILSSRSKGGFFLPSPGEQGREEIRACVRSLRAQATNTLKVLKPLSMALNEVEGQISIDTEMRDA